MSGGKALRIYDDQLSEFEQGEILDYNQVYFLGLEADKIKTSGSRSCNNEYDTTQGDYRIVLRDHILYRYEVIEMLGKGSFGQVIKCFDHKQNEFVALKMLKNKKEYRQEAATEIKMLRYIKVNDYENKVNLVRFNECFTFRHHFVLYSIIIVYNL